MANYTIDKFTYGGNTYKLNDKDAMPKTGGTFTGEVTFGDTVTASDVTADSLVVQGNTSVVNGLQVSTINGVTVGSEPAFTDTTYTASAPISISNDNNITHNTSGVTANTYGSATQVPKITVNATGHITAVTNTTITGVTPASHTHGDITNGGDITATAPTIASGDKIIINDESASKITNGPSFGTSTSTYLRNDGAWGTPANTTYTFANGTNGFTVTPSGGSAQTVTVTPSITNNITGSGTSGYLTKFNGTNTITSGPALNSSGSTTKYLCEKGTWQQLPTASTAFQTVTVGDVELAATNSTDIQFIADEGITLTGDNSNDENKLTIKNSGAIYSVMSGFTTSAGSATSGSYLSVKWTISDIDGITTPYNGMRVAIKIPLIGVGTAGAVMSIDGGTTYHPLSYNTGILTSHYPANSVKYFTYDANASLTAYLTSNVSTSITGVWRADADYDSNSNNYDRTLVTYGCGKSGSNGVKQYSIALRKSDDTLESLTTTSGTGTSKTINTSSFKLEEIYFFSASSDLAANTAITNSVLYSIYSPLIDARYSFNCGSTLTGNKPLYMVGTMSGSLFTLASPYWAQSLPSSADNKVYIFLGRAYDTYRFFLASYHPIYYYSNGAVRAYTGLSSAASSTTGISISNHGTGTVSSKKSGSNGTAPTLGTAFTVPNVTSAGSASTWAFTEVSIPNVTSAGSASTWAFTEVSIPNVTSAGSASTWTFEEKSIPNVTAAGSGSFTSGAFSGGSGSFSATVTNHVLSFSHTHTAATHGADSHTHTAPTLGTAIKVQSKSGGGNGTAPTLGTAIKVQSKSSGGNGTAPTLGTAIKVQSKSSGGNGTAPTLGTAFTIPNVTSVGSASTWVFEDKTVVTGASHTITDNGHTHTLS